MKIIHNEIYEKAKININTKIEKAPAKISSQSKKFLVLTQLLQFHQQRVE